MTLVDTSVWVEHFRLGSPRLRALLGDGQVCCHPFIVGELSCGSLHSREEILGLLTALPEVSVAEHQEVLHLVETRRLFGRGLGWADVHLLAAALLARCGFWTLDRALQRAARSLKIPE